MVSPMKNVSDIILENCIIYNFYFNYFYDKTYDFRERGIKLDF